MIDCEYEWRNSSSRSQMKSLNEWKNCMNESTHTHTCCTSHLHVEYEWGKNGIYIGFFLMKKIKNSMFHQQVVKVIVPWNNSRDDDDDDDPMEFESNQFQDLGFSIWFGNCVDHDHYDDDHHHHIWLTDLITYFLSIFFSFSSVSFSLPQLLFILSFFFRFIHKKIFFTIIVAVVPDDDDDDDDGNNDDIYTCSS